MKTYKLLIFIFLALLISLVITISCGDDDDDDDDYTVPSNLIWQDPPSNNYMTWEEAVFYCQNLSFDDHDDWRLPNISELRSLIRGCDETELDGICDVTVGCTNYICWQVPCLGPGCDELEGPGSGGAYWPNGISGKVDWYWSSSQVADRDKKVWYVDFYNGRIDFTGYASGGYARCVR